VARAEQDEAVIRVRDNGMGIATDALTHIFDMFSQVERPENVQGGLGIGLSLVRQLTELHGGKVEASSAGPGEGAEFVVRLPLASTECERTEERRSSVPSAGRRLRVLLVDDNADLVEMLALVVETAGHEVRKALDGRTAVQAGIDFRPDVVFLDLGLPVMTGFDVARALRRHPATERAHLVALTGRGQPGDRQQTLEAGFEHHLTKPSDPDAVLQLLAELAGQ
jgi:CheY-like chemotaxis protein